MTVHRFAEDASWNAFGMAFAGVFAVVLMTFMVVTPVCTAGLPFLPHIATAGIVASGPADLRVTVTRDGLAYVDDGAYAQSTFGERIDRALASTRYQRVIVRADKASKYATLLPIFRAAQTHHVPVVFENRSESLLERIESERIATSLQ